MRPSILWVLISIALIGLLATLTGLAMTSFGSVYGTPADVQSLESYNKLTQLSANMEAVKKDTTNLKEQTGVLDRIGASIMNAYNVLITIPQSVDLIGSMMDQAVKDANLGEGGAALRAALGLIIIILIFIGVFLAALIKWYL